MSPDDFHPGGDRFPPTRRSVIEAVRSIDAEERERALAALCAAYWKPIYKYIRLRWNRPAEEAQDLTQGFFVEVFERELLRKFDPQKGRLRTYLRVCVDSFVSNEEKANRLIREALVLAQLEHPGIVPVHDVGTLADGRVFYIMKFVQGQRLDKYVEPVASITDRLRIFLRICDAVAFAHARGVLHRDLKPANIMVGPFGEVLVMDWGLAKLLRGVARVQPAASDPDATIFEKPETGDSREPMGVSTATGHGTIMGTPGYMSPEQARGDVEHLNACSDIYSLGALLRFLLTGDADARGSRRPDKALEAICSKATSPAPDDRYASVQDLAQDVSRYLDGFAVAAHHESLIEKLARLYRRYRFFILLIAAYLAMRVAILFFFHR